MRTGAAVVRFGIVALAAAACTRSDPTDVDDGSVVGVWRTGSSSAVESTLEFASNGTYRVVDADFGLQQCTIEEGTWTQGETTLSIRVTSRDGVATSEVEDVPFTLSGSTLVTQPGSADEEVWSRFTSMRTCADYGWPSFAMGAEVDGVPYDFGDNPPNVVLSSAIEDGIIMVGGWYNPDGPASTCVDCRVLELTIFTELASPLVPGTYPIEAFAEGGLSASALLRVDYPSSDEHYRSDEGDPGTQPPSGQVTLTTVTAERIEGTFAFVLYNGREPGPPYPSVTVTNGFFRLAYD